jgi:repressor LexA
MILDEPTDRQLEILRFIARETEADGYAPTIREIMAEFELSSTNTVADHLKALRRKGFIERADRGRARTLRLTEHGRRQIEGHLPTCPACGQKIRRAA